MINDANHPTDRDDAAQARALSCERGAAPPTHDPNVDAYRLIHRAILAAPMPEPPAGFAARVAAQAGDLHDDARLETLLQRLMLTGVTIAALLYSAPYLQDAAVSTAAMGKDLPLPMLLATGIGLALAGAIDRLAFGRQHPA